MSIKRGDSFRISSGLTEAHMVERPFLSVFLLLCNRNLSFFRGYGGVIFVFLSAGMCGVRAKLMIVLNLIIDKISTHG